jgi:heptosyltransferase-3
MTQPSSEIHGGESPRILVLQFHRIGDLVLTTPALQLLRETWPKAHLTLVLNESCESLGPALTGIDQILVSKHSLRDTLRLTRELLFLPYDLCLDFTGSDRSALLALCSKAPTRLAFVPAGKKRFLRRWIASHQEHPTDPNAHEISRLLQLISPLGIGSPQDSPPPRLMPPPIAKERITRLLFECGIPGPFVLIHPGSGAAEKYWRPERWAEVILHLQHHHQLPCVLTGGSDPYEQEHLREIQTAMAVLGQGPLPLPFVRLAGELDLTLLAALTEKARLLVSCDTAVIHIASAFARPQVTLFGPTNPFRWRPTHSRSLIVSGSLTPNLPQEFSPDAPPQSMESISTLSVLEACAQLLQSPAFPLKTL